MKDSVNITWLDGLGFEADVSGKKVIIDATSNVGGKGRGPQPKPLLMVSLGGCTAMDVISILKKMRVDVKDLNVIVEGELTDEHPKHFYKMHVIYEVTGKDLPLEKVKKAVTLSEDRYCGVSAVYKQTIEITSEIRLIEG